MSKTYQFICKQCNNPFICNRANKAFCSRQCYRRSPEIAKRYNEKTNIYQKAHAREIPRRFQKLVFKSKSENHVCDLTLEWFSKLLNQPCYYCNSSLLEETGCGLDRKDNKLGYSEVNVLPCCGTCNQIRNVHLTVEEMKVAMEAVLKFRNGDK